MTTPTPSSVWVVCDKEGDCLFASEHKSIADDHFQHCVDEESDFRAGPYTLTEYVPKRDLAAAQEARQRAEALAEQNAKDAKEAIAIAGFLFDAWEDGTPCFETDGESGMGASIGKAFKLSNEDFTRCTEFLNRVDPHGAAIDAARAK